MIVETTISVAAAALSSDFAVNVLLNEAEWHHYDSDSVPNALRVRSDLIECLEHSDCGRYVFAIGDGRILAEIVNIIRHAKFVLSACAAGWTAIEPLPEFWDDAPGAHIRWTAYVSGRDLSSGPTDVLFVDYYTIIDERHVIHQQGVDGWRIAVSKAADTLNVTYMHSDMMAHTATGNE